MPEISLRIDVRSGVGEDLNLAVEHIRKGGVVAYPTETVYGFGSLPTAKGVTRIQKIKHRTFAKPLIILTPTIEEVSRLAWNDQAGLLASVFWPGPLTLLLGDPYGIFPLGIRSETDKVGVRLSSSPIVECMLEKLGRPLTSTSVNLPGEPPAKSGSEVVTVVSRLNGSEVMLVDSGTLPISEPSTIVDCTVNPPTILREGKTHISALREVVPELYG